MRGCWVLALVLFAIACGGRSPCPRYTAPEHTAKSDGAQSPPRTCQVTPR